MPYEPTIWQDRIVEKPRTYSVVNNPDGTITLMPAPGQVVQEGTPVNAVKMNNLEGQYAAAAADLASKAAVDAFLRDQYELHTELYYTGHHGGPSIAGLLGMMLDGFIDMLRVNAGATSAVVDTTNKLVKCPSSVLDYVFASAVNQQVSTLSDGSDWDNIANAVDGNIGTFANCHFIYEAPQPACVKFDFGQIRKIDTLRVYGYAPAGARITWLEHAYSTDGINWTLQQSPYVAEEIIISSSQWISMNVGSLISARYWGITFRFFVESATHNDFLLREVAGSQSVAFSNSLLQSTTKILEIPPSQVTLYMSVKTPSNSSVAPQISCDGGTHWEAPTLDSSRVDPQFSDYTERRYTLNPQYPGTSLILKASLTPSTDQFVTPEIKRYGLYWS